MESESSSSSSSSSWGGYYSYEERLLVGSEEKRNHVVDHHQNDTPSSSTSSSSTTKTITTVRLESTAEWDDGSWIRPVVSLDLLKDHPLVTKVQMGIASHPTQSFPSNVLDPVPLLSSSSTTTTTKNQYDRPVLPQGFFLSIETRNTVTKGDTSSAAVDAVVKSLIRNRLLTTPITDGTWDILEKKDDDTHGAGRGLVYNIYLPFNGAGWSGDALEQTFRRTLPTMCSGEMGKADEASFFGWSSQQWSNFLVGNPDGTSPIPFTKQMWWTWTTSSSSSSSSSSANNFFNFGIQYQAIRTKLLPDSSPIEFVPTPFLSESSGCRLGPRTMFHVVVPKERGYYQMIALGSDGSPDADVPSTMFLPYKATIEQVLRRHHTNRGRFESTVNLRPLATTIDSTVPSKAESCEMTYRQVFPKFVSPVWHSLNVTSSTDDDGATKGLLDVWVEWKTEDPQGSILYVKSLSALVEPSPQLPSSVSISLEYAPTFLTLDDFPGDPNRGRELPPAHVTIRCRPTGVSDQRRPAVVSVYSNSLIVLPPVPDMSMPFNVISLTSSLYAYIIGTLLTILVRKGSERIKFKLYPQKRPESKLQKLKRRIGIQLSRIRGTAKKEDTDNVVQDEGEKES
jgi:hypothetical protein